MFYAGIGSRETPQFYLNQMINIGRICGKRGLVLRSGGARGADQAFEKGCDMEKGHKMIWRATWGELIKEEEWAKELASTVCWEYPLKDMRSRTRNLIIRNMYQIFGERNTTPVDFCIYYNLDDPMIKGSKGGTRYAVRVAKQSNIPCFNLRTEQREFADFFKAYFEKPHNSIW